MENLIPNLQIITKNLSDWIDNPISKGLIGKNSVVASKQRQLKKHNWRIEKLRRSLDRNSAVSVYGPSQAGKSFLVSILAKPDGKDLVANYEGIDNKLNYISEINPAGDGESTGIVTRFTSRAYKCPREYPIRVELLSEIDVVCTLCNSFFLDGDQSEPIPTPEDFEKHFKSFETKLTQNMSDKIEISEFWELEEYIRSKFEKTAYGNALLLYFEKLMNLGAKLDLHNRANLYSVLWGFHQPLSDLFLQLAKNLENINFCETLFLQKEALVPKSGSIIDVKSLKGIDAEKDETLNVCTLSGKTYSFSRSILSALTAELTVPMEITPHDFLEHTDLLDFPGARNRFKRSLFQAFEPATSAKPDEKFSLSGLLLRGKIAYLFDKYAAAQEITAMLLCVPDGNLEAVDLPILVENWIHDVVGASPGVRENAENTLFFVLTKFDLHLNDTASSFGETDRFKRRLEASLFEKFGRNKDNWLQKWDRNQAFKNCFWLRNPNVEQSFFERNENLESLNPSKATRLAELREMYLSTEEVQKHFSNPLDAWEAAVTPNDGGAKYLVKALSNVCDVDTKVIQVEGQLKQISNALINEFEPYYVPDDFEKKREIQLDKLKVLEEKVHLLIDQNRFGQFLEKICIFEYTIEAQAQYPSRFQIEPFINQCLNAWVNDCERVKNDLIDIYGLSDETASFTLKELERAILNRSLIAKLKKNLDFLVYGFDLRKQLSSASSICCDGINSVITNPKRPAVGSILEHLGGKSIELSEVHSSPARAVGKQWLSEMQTLVLENVTQASGNSIDIENNNSLGKTLTFIKEKCING